ncbi:hypothetical protein HRbin02_01600 [Candidatus Calditenuaceae archaeon HR02]|nr:hypothetical protein HRbin02_01600 [Candidatus Calditenuaceae archaeon HR02]
METVIYQCPGCGAPHSASEEDVAIKCSYCGTSFRTFKEEKRFVFPVYYDSSAAIENFILWVKKQTGYEESMPFHINLIDVKLHFLPFWTATVRAKTTFTGLGEDAKFSSPDALGYRSMKIVLREESGSFERFMEVAIPASGEVKVEGITAVSRRRLYFSHEYVRQKGGILHGATVPRSEADALIRQMATSELTKLISREIVEVKSRSDEMEVSDLALVYIPIWEVIYEFKNRKYRALIDASSARIIEATYPPDILEKAGYVGLGAAHLAAGVAAASIFWPLGFVAAAAAFLGFLGAALVYFWRGVKPTRAAETIQAKSALEVGTQVLSSTTRRFSRAGA